MMTTIPNGTTWFSKHASAHVFYGLLGLWVIFGLVGVSLHDSSNPWLNFLGKWLVEVSIAAFVGGAAGILLSVREMREHLISTTATLFTEGKFFKLLSEETQRTMSQEATRARLSGVSCLERSLYDHFSEFSDHCLQTVHLHDYHSDKRFSDHGTEATLLIEERMTRFGIVASHLSHPANFEFLFFQEVDLRSFPQANVDMFLLEFEADFGGNLFSKKHMSVELITDPVPVIRLMFKRNINIDQKEPVPSSIRYRIAYPKTENVNAFFARYPTKGFEVRCSYNDAFNYDCAWFQGTIPSITDLPGAKEIKHLANGISAATTGWILPGEGAALIWTPKAAPSKQ